MEIPSAGLRPPDFPAPSRLDGIQGPGVRGPALNPIAAVSADNVATLLELLATPEIGGLVASVDRTVLTASHAATETVLQAAVAAVVERNYPAALEKVKELLTLNPEHAESLVRNPSLQPIQREIASLVGELKLVAKLDAADKIASANHAILHAESQGRASPDVDPKMVLWIATHFFNTDQLIGYRRSAELARTAVALCEAGEPGGVKTGAALKVVERVRFLWRRAPLLILFAAWFAFGWVAGYKVWALGFLALVGFHFYARIRNVRF
jgi:hypothetical protein